MREVTRREWLVGSAALASVGAARLPKKEEKKEEKNADPFRYMLNTATIRGQNLPIERELDIASRAGYQAIEPWMDRLRAFVEKGGNPADLRKRFTDAGLRVESAIGFAEWIVDDEGQRRKGLEQARRDMDLVRQIGGSRIAAPPSGATKGAAIDLRRAGERYRALLELGDRIGVIPQVEIWGFSTSLSRLGEGVQVAIESGHPKACVLADVYHLHKGGSGFAGLRLLGPSALPVFHMNDYPALPPRETITDAQRVYPGDGVAPLVAMLRDLRQSGFTGFLSLELFNRDYWKQDPLMVARDGLAKMKTVVAASLRS